MKNFKGIIMVGFMLFIVMLSKPAIGEQLNTFSDVPNFSIVIGENMYTLEYANNLKNINEISYALVKNQGDIFIKISNSGWIRNSDGKQASKESVNLSIIKFSNGKAIAGAVKEPVKDTSEILANAKVDKIQFTSAISKTGISMAMFKYRLLDKNGIDITKAIPASNINAIASASSLVSLDPLTGTGTITFNSSADADKLYIVTLIDNMTDIVAVKSSRDVEVNNNDTEDLHVISIDAGKLTKIGASTVTFKYKILNKSGIDITKAIPAFRISAISSVSSNIVLDPSTGTGTITFNSSSDVDKEISIYLMDMVTGLTVNSTMSTSTIVP